MPAAIANPNQQAAPTSIDRLCEQYFATGQAAHARFQFADSMEGCTILVTQRQKKQQVFNPMKIEFGQRFRQRRTDTLENGEWIG